MTDGLQRECPGCHELNNPDSLVCVECGKRLLTDKELQDWYRLQPQRGTPEWENHPLSKKEEPYG
jgi:hypothetical protein